MDDFADWFRQKPIFDILKVFRVIKALASSIAHLRKATGFGMMRRTRTHAHLYYLPYCQPKYYEI